MTAVKLKVFWIPQIPMKAFEVEISSVEEGRKICDVLANYDLFQFENHVKPDYCNAGGIVCSHPEIDGGEWFDVPDDEDEFEEWLAEIAAADARVALPQSETAEGSA
jgi:hypothetical protein